MSTDIPPGASHSQMAGVKTETDHHQPRRSRVQISAATWLWDGQVFRCVRAEGPWPKGRAAFRRHLRRLIRNPPFNPDIAREVVQWVRLGLPIKAAVIEPRIVALWRQGVPAFDEALLEADAHHEAIMVGQVSGLVKAGAPATMRAIRKTLGGTPREVKRWLDKALARGEES